MTDTDTTDRTGGALLLARIGDTLTAVPVEAVAEVVRVPENDAPSLRYHGMEISVINLPEAIGLASEGGGAPRILVFKGDPPAAVRVSAVEGIAQQTSQPRPARACPYIRADWGRLLHSVTNVGGRIAFLLNPEEISTVTAEGPGNRENQGETS